MILFLRDSNASIRGATIAASLGLLLGCAHNDPEANAPGEPRELASSPQNSPEANASSMPSAEPQAEGTTSPPGGGTDQGDPAASTQERQGPTPPGARPADPSSSAAPPRGQAATAPNDRAAASPGASPGAQAPTAPGASPGAQASTAPGASPGAQAPGKEVTDQEVEAFAACHLELTKLGQQMSQRVQGGEPASQVEQEFEVEASKIIQDSPLSEQRYTEIAQRTRSDLDLQKRIEAALQEEIGG